MPIFLIEVAHDPEVVACARVVQVFLTSGSHFLSNADWGCLDDQHSAWMLVEVGSKNEALQIVPPAFRSHAKIVQLNKFTIEQIEEILQHHMNKRKASNTAPPS